MIYRRMPNVSPDLIEIFKHILGGFYFDGLYSERLIFGGYFVLLSAYQDFKSMTQ